MFNQDYLKFFLKEEEMINIICNSNNKINTININYDYTNKLIKSSSRYNKNELFIINNKIIEGLLIQKN
jgi:hypothetical protein